MFHVFLNLFPYWLICGFPAKFYYDLFENNTVSGGPTGDMGSLEDEVPACGNYWLIIHSYWSSDLPIYYCNYQLILQRVMRQWLQPLRPHCIICRSNSDFRSIKLIEYPLGLTQSSPTQPGLRSIVCLTVTGPTVHGFQPSKAEKAIVKIKGLRI